MQSSGEKLTIAEFAARAGCTTQRVSQLLRKSLKQFQIIENGRKYILSDGLQVVLEAREKQGYRKSFETVSETLANSCETVSNPDFQAKIEELTAELDELRGKLEKAQDEAAKAQAAIEDQQKQNAALTAELHRTRADLEAAREQRQKAEIRTAAAEAAADAERKRADSECKRADAAEKQCTVKDNQAAQQAQTVTTLTAALQTAQEHAKELNAALTAAQALHAGTIQKQLETKDGEPDIPADQQPKKKRGLFGGLFHREKKEG